MNNQKAKMYVDNLLGSLKAGTIRITPTGELQGASLNLGLATSRHEIEAAIRSRNGTDADVSQFRAGLSGKVQAAPAHEPPPKPEPSPEQKAQAAICKELERLDLRMKGLID